MQIISTIAAFVLGAVIAALFIAAAVRATNTRRKKKKTQPDKPKRKFEFVKIVVFCVLLTYFVGLGFGVYAVKKILLDYPDWAIQALIALFGYIATPTGIAIGFYCWKAKAENIIKIKKENPEETAGIPVDLNNIIS